MSKEIVHLNRVASREAVFAIDTATDGRVTGILLGITDDVGGARLPRGNIVHKGIVLKKNGRAMCIPVSRSVYEKFLAEVERRHIQLVEA